MTHWHIASGLAGYGPDGADGYDTARTEEEIADAVRDELSQWADFEYESAEQYATDEDYKAAWLLAKHVDEIGLLRETLNNDRAQAPLYRDDRAAWKATIMRVIGERFPYDVNEGRSRVYVWACTDTDAGCEHNQSDD